MPYSRPYASGFSDYPATTTPINATALNTMDVGIKTANDQFQTVTTAQRTALVPTVGQAVWDSDLKQLMVFMNASGGNAWQPVGNRIVCTSTTRPSSPFEGQEIYETDTNKTYVYTGSMWLETGDLDNAGGLADATYNSLRRIAYTASRTTDYTIIDAVVSGAANFFSSSLSFTADGTSAYRVEFFTPGMYSPSTANGISQATLTTNAGATIAIMGQVGMGNGTQKVVSPVNGVYYYTPSAGTATLNIRGTMTGGSTGGIITALASSSVYAYLAVFGPPIT